MFNWLVSDVQQYLELFNFVDLHKIELFDHFSVSIYKMCLQIIYLVYMYK